MSLKKAILSVVPRQQLTRIVDDLAVEGVDRRSARAMSEALLRARRARAETLLGFLDDESVRAACTAYEIPPRGTRAALIERLLETEAYRASGSEVALHATGPFLALDFDTADLGRDSACVIRAVRVDGCRISAAEERLARPPRRRVSPTVHADWDDLKNAPRFGEAWRGLLPLLEDVGFIAAHNVSWVRSVLTASCAEARVAPPALPFQSTARLARRVWNLRDTKLPEVCRHLGLALVPDDPMSALSATARVVVAARTEAARRN